MYNPFSLIGKTILVTGASSGIGRATAVECSKMGATLILIGRNEERLKDEEQPFANPRNAASGSLKLIDSRQVANRGLECTLYHMLGENLPFTTHDQAMRAHTAPTTAPLSSRSTSLRFVKC